MSSSNVSHQEFIEINRKRELSTADSMDNTNDKVNSKGEHLIITTNKEKYIIFGNLYNSCIPLPMSRLNDSHYIKNVTRGS